ncbi:MAG: glycosyltransferase family 4 protein, partial [Patescibacteria group bacterium]
ITHLSCTAPPEIGGIGTVAAKEVALLRARSLDARLIAPEPLTDLQEEARSSFERLPALRIGNGAILRGLDARLRQTDVVHLHYPFYGTAERLLWRRGHIPVVVTFHMDAKPEGWKGMAVDIHREWLQPYLLSRAATVIVSSFDYAHRSSLEPWFAEHIDRVVELPFGVDTEFFAPGSSSRERFSVPSDAPTFLFVGGLDQAHAFKGVEELLRAFASIDAHAHLLIVGEGNLRATYEDQARALGIAHRVHFLGRLDAVTLRDAFCTADVFVFPSTSSAEAFGLAALEAESCGVPVIASDLPGVRTVVLHGQTGLLVPPKDVVALTNAMASLAADPVRRAQMGREARRLAVERFSWDTHIDGLMQIYQRVCASRS